MSEEELDELLRQAVELCEEMDVNNGVMPTRRRVEGVCEDCDRAMTQDNGCWVCSYCGTMDHEVFLRETAVGTHPRKKCIYKRRSYFVERMNLLCGHKQSRSKLYPGIVQKIRQYGSDNEVEVKSVRELRSIMKKCHAHKFYKYIYNIYFDLTAEWFN